MALKGTDGVINGAAIETPNEDKAEQTTSECVVKDYTAELAVIVSLITTLEKVILDGKATDKELMVAIGACNAGIMTVAGDIEMIKCSFMSTTIGWTSLITTMAMSRDIDAFSGLVTLAIHGYNLDNYEELMKLVDPTKADSIHVLDKFFANGSLGTRENFVTVIKARVETLRAGKEENVKAASSDQDIEDVLKEAEDSLNEAKAKVKATLEAIATNKTNNDSSSTSIGDIALGVGGIVVAGLALYAGYCYFFDGCRDDDTIVID